MLTNKQLLNDFEQAINNRHMYKRAGNNRGAAVVKTQIMTLKRNILSRMEPDNDSSVSIEDAMASWKSADNAPSTL